MEQKFVQIPESTFGNARVQPESVLLDLFDNLFVKSDTSSLSEKEKLEINEAKSEYFNNETIAWENGN